MALFDRFKRNKNQNSVMPAEVQDYYKAERRDKTGMAWVLAVVTLLATFLIAAGLFFGGRFVYRAVFDNDNDTAQTQNDSENTSEESGEGTTPPSTTGQTPAGSNSGGQTSSTNTTTTPPATTPGANTPATTPNTGPSELINTGPGDE